jgi:hypothetical protein
MNDIRGIKRTERVDDRVVRQWVTLGIKPENVMLVTDEHFWAAIAGGTVVAGL